ncbi:MAG TPA: tetratricopeptide repeat protein [Candidatus Obscuribacterales bacterium]
MNKVHLYRELAQFFEEKGDYERAKRLLTAAYQWAKEMLADDHPDLMADLYNLGLLCLALDDHAGAEEYLLSALRMQTRQLGPEHQDVKETENALAMLYTEQDVFALVKPLRMNEKAVLCSAC